jgi:hypothetical protein
MVVALAVTVHASTGGCSVGQYFGVGASGHGTGRVFVVV